MSTMDIVQPVIVIDDGNIRIAIDHSRQLVFIEPTNNEADPFAQFFHHIVNDLAAVEKPTYKSAKRYRK